MKNTFDYMEKMENTNPIEKWIYEKIKGGPILNIGCAKGLDSFFLAGEKVNAVDHFEESVQCVNQLLDREEPSDCRCNDQMVVDVEGETFHSVIVRNIFEYGTDAQKVMEKAFELLKEDGRLVITVSYESGRSLELFFATEVYQLQTESLQIMEMQFFNNGMGAVFKKVSGSWQLQLDLNSLPMTMEEAWQQEKQASIDRIMKNIYLQEHLEAAYSREEKLLISYKQLWRKYQALSTSKLGKFALYYWKKRRSLFGGKSSG
ncbi:methyltransferase domain-containing protein [Siminovitchia acidinfaciens]|uniref:Methyltransferase domain-containing protein n=1 Tax=Siminovitchia acidinfaciens TaxID=2321395 RepID=A0A429XZE9_9BACI|nr:methyltransferase domain-containing protein [Siminovitchia acidinfaciens]RST74150.1 methyltransferase domain-containing protein [Siminovitchia acidinfaciens]